MVEVNKQFTRIRLDKIEGRKYKNSNDKHQKYQNRIQEGSIVTLKNPELIVKKPDHKLRLRYKNKYIVIKRSELSLFLQPCQEINLSQGKVSKSTTKF